ncbi:MAG: coproporphyrinogen III oxidase, partial [Firmicutes bacterium]|nr:coproporphyrinogen III oxidase [Bacillota bacterium]
DVDFFDVYSPEILTKLRGLLVSDGQNLRLTDAGFDVSNRVMAEFV